jgi:hypothetical protein
VARKYDPGHFEALADRCSNTLPAPERHDLRARFLGLLAMARSRSFSRDERRGA